MRRARAVLVRALGPLVLAAVLVGPVGSAAAHHLGPPQPQRTEEVPDRAAGQGVAVASLASALGGGAVTVLVRRSSRNRATVTVAPDEVRTELHGSEDSVPGEEEAPAPAGVEYVEESETGTAATSTNTPEVPVEPWAGTERQQSSVATGTIHRNRRGRIRR